MSGPTKPAGKSAAKPVKKPAALPDRQAMEAFLNAKGRRAADAATGKAQQIMYDAWDTSASRTRVAMAKKALATSPLCADAFVLLAYAADRVWSLNGLLIIYLTSGRVPSPSRCRCLSHTLYQCLAEDVFLFMSSKRTRTALFQMIRPRAYFLVLSSNSMPL